jgi:hypothetical protein
MEAEMKELPYETPSSAQGEARDQAVINKHPYCYRCLTKGHPKECTRQLFCDIYVKVQHMSRKLRCPLYKKASKLYAVTCGYAVDGLGFYYILHS